MSKYRQLPDDAGVCNAHPGRGDYPVRPRRRVQAETRPVRSDYPENAQIDLRKSEDECPGYNIGRRS